MKTSEIFWRDLDNDPPNQKALRAEKYDLTRTQREMIASVAVFDNIMNTLSAPAAKIFLAGMYLQGSLTSDARIAYQALIAEIDTRKNGQNLHLAPVRKSKTIERLARGL